MRHLTSPVATTKLLQSSHGSRVEELKEKICELHNELAVAESHYAKQIDAHKVRVLFFQRCFVPSGIILVVCVCICRTSLLDLQQKMRV